MTGQRLGAVLPERLVHAAVVVAVSVGLEHLRRRRRRQVRRRRSRTGTGRHERTAVHVSHSAVRVDRVHKVLLVAVRWHAVTPAVAVHVDGSARRRMR